ncbi:MAG TPA: septal ring lytic transglycosylase RlpA family protein [Flavisolibacter sp.]|jgi:rare lipoprotein A|nr:septal ring lytic transglycosylase RlpA family protein [Flavisolibacter sp.]
MKIALVIVILLFCSKVYCQTADSKVLIAGKTLKESTKRKVYFGVASYYADRFDGHETANGEIYNHSKKTAACNVLPLGTWIRVTNISNNRSVVVHTNDRLHIRMKRIVDLSRSAAEVLGYTKKGLTQVKVEILEKAE